MVVRLERFDGVSVARLPSDVDAANALNLGQELAASLGHDATDLVVDLGATRYLDSAGIHMLFRLDARLRQRRQRLRVVVPRESPILRLLEIASLSKSVPLYPSIPEAVKASSDPSAQIG
jgi:anti-anti-sigma factor